MAVTLPEQEKRTAAVVVSFNVRELLAGALTSLYENGISEVAVVDNASADGSADMVGTGFPRVRLLALTENVGFGRAANLGARLTQAPYILFLNPDAAVMPGGVKTLADFLDRRPAAGAVGPRVVNPRGELEPTMRDDPTVWNLLREHLPVIKNSTGRFGAHDKRRQIDWLVGVTLMVRREAFEKIGGFDEKIFLYYEDADLCLRLRDAGYEIWFEPAATVTHQGAASAIQAFGSAEGILLRQIKARLAFISRRWGKGAAARHRFALSVFLWARWLSAFARGDRRQQEFVRRALAAAYGK